MKQFKNFKASAPKDFKEKMISYWMEDEELTREEALETYGSGFNKLCESIIEVEREYKPDLGYWAPGVDGTLCFEVEDNNFVIPVNILKVIK